MSECTGSKCKKKEDFQVLLSKKDPRESSQHKHYLWMAHWTKASSSAEPLKVSNRLEDANKGTSTKFMKSTVAERLMVGVSHGSASVQHAHQFNSTMWGVAHNVCKELGQKGNEQCHESFERSMKQNDMNLLAQAVVSETYSIRKLSELPLDFQKLGSSDDPNSDRSHFPMFEINRQIDKILNPKCRSALGPASLNVKMSASHVMALSSQEYRMQSHPIADENVDICKPAGGTVSHLKDPTNLGTDPSGQELKGHLSDTMSCPCNKDDNNSSNCLIDEQQTRHYFANSNQNPPYASSEKKSKYARSNKNQIAVHKQQDAAGVMFCAPVLGREFQNEPINCSNNRKQDGALEMYKSHGNVVSSSLLPYEQQHLKTHRMESAANLKDSYMPPDPITNILIANSNGEPLAHGKEPTEKSTGSCKRKRPCLFETLTIPSKSQSAYPKNSVSSGKSSGFGVCMYGTNIGSRLFGTQNQSSAKTETLYSDTLVSKSSAGIASLSAQKDYSRPNETKTEQLATPSMRGGSGYSKVNGFSNVNEHQSEATTASKQSCMPGTGNTNLDLILFQMGRMRNRISSNIVQPAVGAEPSDQWLKRLQLNTSDPELPSSKRSKLGDSPPPGEASCLFGMALHCDNDDAEIIGRFKEDQALDEGSKLQDNQEIPPVPAKSMDRWVGRWCQGGTPAFHGDPGQGRQATKPDQASEKLGCQFPSIAAMAMMGRAMNKLRPCEHQKKGPFVVWKIE
ncbi:uncharacterized protein LOC133884803 [Phragmites australis]|uniref:uncharacterized protein LOC133884803 n=1 Tax=Phragmites australis TaxID=29695 RepID=UPI002D768F18|nr:uncharacterized protein LOC133884803 [Phragmites australis]XP_062180347.1 uncharacterized protein LOC133884803 [Phragmites australis]